MELRERGISLLEVVLALLVLSLGVFASAALQVRAWTSADGARRDAQAVQLAQDLLEQVRASGQLEGAAVHRWQLRIQALLGRSGTGRAVVAGRSVQLQICWIDGRDSRPQRFELHGRLDP